MLYDITVSGPSIVIAAMLANALEVRFAGVVLREGVLMHPRVCCYSHLSQKSLLLHTLHHSVHPQSDRVGDYMEVEGMFSSPGRQLGHRF